jgi:DNA-binding response OmpR family regulator
VLIIVSNLNKEYCYLTRREVKMSTIKGKKLLIVDDESDITFTIKSILEDNGFKVDSFTDSISALDNYQINFYDLVILDIKMPKMDGFQLYVEIRKRS